MLQVARIVLLVISLLGVATWGFWSCSPDSVRELNQGLRWAYIQSAEETLRSAKEEAKLGHAEEALELVTEFTEGVGELQLWDRVDRYYTDCMTLRTELLYEAGDAAGAIACSRELANFDSRNLRNKVALARLLLISEETREEGEALLAELHALVPEWSLVAEPYTAYLVGAERWQEAADVGLDFIRGSRWLIFRNWSIVMSGGEKFSGDHRVSVNLSPKAEAGVYEVVYRLPPYDGALRHLRVAPPKYSPAKIVDWEFVAAAGEDRRILSGAAWLERQAAAGKPTADGVLPPNFVWHLAKPLAGQEGIAIRFRAHVSLEAPAALRRLWANPEARRDVDAWLVSNGRLEDQELLEAVLGG